MFFVRSALEPTKPMHVNVSLASFSDTFERRIYILSFLSINS